MTEATLSIGQVAERTGMSVHALRLYERRGLLASEIRRDAAGRRLYTGGDVEWLTNCVRFRASGMSLETIGRLAELVRQGTGNEAERLELLREHQRRINEQLDQLRACLDIIDAKVSGYERHLAYGVTGDPWQSHVPA
ncbi:MerR family transcriptional regulator [Plantactinospora endophytica]|uniref:MerR family transcriptional regulator n=1 Tax=Plantactinospora endophytica TaxID=673535 RepID=A0ABQ4EC33_9ACTN|nr:MerR family transcriptional regulator [Plantactinospora endophytica]GIG92210.1 MerR family transcriptional regulator [Plantactinospora endophytica]